MSGAAVACSGGDETADPARSPAPPEESTTTTTEPRLDIDPRSYYENYVVAAEDTALGGAPSRSTSPNAASDAAGESGAAVESEEPPLPQPEPVEPGFLDDNTFTDPGTNPFVTTAEDPESTFALDVDTGSFAIGRTFLEEGYLPDPASVRTEEWVNAFEYGYTPPDVEADGAAADLAVHVDGVPAPFTDDGTQLVRIGMQGRMVDTGARPPAALTLVVDTSGSMDIRERLGLVRSTLALLALHLRDDDTVSVVTYSDGANVLLPPTPVVEAETIVGVIEQLTPSGSTNMEAGLREGYAQARAAFRPDAINTVILASDGVANVGITGTDPLSELVRTEGEGGIGLVTVGYGMGNYNDTLMEQLADRGDGFYSYVDTYEEAERLFTTELTSTLTVIAEETRAQVTFDPAAVESYRLVGYENRDLADESFRDDSVDAGELGAGHTVTALYEVRRTADGSAELGAVTLRHRPTGSDEFVEQTVPISTEDLVARIEDASPSLRLAAAASTFAELLAQHPPATDRAISIDGLVELVGGIAAESPPPDEAPIGGRADAQELARLIELARVAAPPIPSPDEELQPR